ncbi:hypothetical protein [Streptomyces apocyni]|uniref:hypothetical protein n=1 Tax=Streptomyces apocyni TaxID=2654677 RepID=UPI0018CFF970|nr:hypothetical protein [Streptomyces apocyni]
MTTDPIYAELDRRAAELPDHVIERRHHPHRDPELSNRETNTERLIAEHLRSLPLDDVRTGIAGHGVAEEGPPVAEKGGLYVMLGLQDAHLNDQGRPIPSPGGRGLITHHHSHFHTDDATLVTGVRLHANVAYDHLTGTLATPA